VCGRSAPAPTGPVRPEPGACRRRRSPIPINRCRWSHWLRADLVHHGHTLGFATAEPVGATGHQGSQQELLDDLAPLLAAAVATSETVVDAVAITRRRKPMSLAAEMQWSMLPPTRFEIDPWVVSAAVEPAYETGGDVFDYAQRNGQLMLAVLDAMGHGLEAALVSVAAMAGLRRARRAGFALLEIAAEVDAAVRALGRSTFVSAVLAEIDLASGRGSYLLAGHVAPVVVDGDELHELELVPTLPLGLRIGSTISRPVVQQLVLDPGQSLVLYSDGIVDNRLIGRDEPAGYDRFSRLVSAQLVDRDLLHPARAVVDGLMALTGPDLRDDATLLVACHR
jgi:sigma-B regulation protein RsbU (phosphoserine phosphatase)